MEIHTVRKLLTEVALQHPTRGDSEEIKALRSLSAALLHVAEAVEELQQNQAQIIARLPAPRS